MTMPKLGNAHIPTLLYAVLIGLGVLFVYHLVHKRG